ncbi:hypothetical protein HK101_000836, partial [Irineochytrium annulatum]
MLPVASAGGGGGGGGVVSVGYGLSLNSDARVPDATTGTYDCDHRPEYTVDINNIDNDKLGAMKAHCDTITSGDAVCQGFNMNGWFKCSPLKNGKGVLPVLINYPGATFWSKTTVSFIPAGDTIPPTTTAPPTIPTPTLPTTTVAPSCASDGNSYLVFDPPQLTIGANDFQSTFTVRLASKPASDVNVFLSSDDAKFDKFEVSFDSNNWDKPQTVQVVPITMLHDK